MAFTDDTLGEYRKRPLRDDLPRLPVSKPIRKGCNSAEQPLFCMQNVPGFKGPMCE